MAINYTLELMTAQQVINYMKPWQRTLFGNSVAQVKALHERQRNSKTFLRPVIAARKRAAKEDPDFQRPDDIMQWLLDNGQAKFGEHEDEELTEIQMGLTFAAIHTTTMTTTNACVDSPSLDTDSHQSFPLTFSLSFLDSTPSLLYPSSFLSCAKRSELY